MSKSVVGNYRRFFVRTLHMTSRKSKRMAVAAVRLAVDLSTWNNQETVIDRLHAALTMEDAIKHLGSVRKEDQ